MKKIFFILCLSASLANGQNPLLWGVSSAGGENGTGNIFNIYGDGTSYTQLYSFPSMIVSFPNGHFTLASNGMLYGIAYYGGANDAGTIYSVDTSTGATTIVYDFMTNGAGGSGPSGSLVAASNGLLYGLCIWSDSVKGCIYSFNPNGNVYTTLKYFPQSDDQPEGNLLQATNGKLYGITTYTGMYDRGSLFCYDISGNSLTFLHDFDLINGQFPLGNGLVQANNGKLFGMTTDGGTSNKGVLFSYDIAGSMFLKILDFTGLNGSQPEGSLVNAANGLLYGVTASGGINNAGIIFSLDPVTSAFTKLFDLDFSTGGKPYGSMIQAGNGLLYGMTHAGGINHHGVIFSFDPVSSIYQNVNDLQSASGEFPNGSLTEVNNELFGVTSNGGLSGSGTIFTYNYTNSSFISMYAFPSDSVYMGWSQLPGALLTQAIDGKVYGVYPYGGANQNGYLFSYDPVTQIFEDWYDFHKTEASQAVLSLLQCTNGKLYGLTSGGGYGEGVIYDLDPTSHEFKIDHNFIGSDGAQPRGGLIELSNGRLYGTTYWGGSVGGTK